MNKILIILFFSLGMNAQIDKHGNPVFNSITVKEEQIPGGLTLLSNYYTLKNNIENKGSSVYVSATPTTGEVIDSAIKLPSDFFIVTRNGNMVAMLMFITYPDQVIIILDPATGTTKEIPVKIKGKITQHRAEEILEQQYDSKAKLLKGELTFEGKNYPVISTDAITKEILSAIEKEELSEKQASDSHLLSNEEIRNILLEESKEGGELDFFTPIAGHEYDGVQIKPGIFTTKLGVALYKWGRAAHELGVNTVEDAISIFAEFKKRPANEREMRSITDGFNKDYEK